MWYTSRDSGIKTWILDSERSDEFIFLMTCVVFFKFDFIEMV